MPRQAVAEYAWLLEQAFDGDEEHSLHANLRSLRDADWEAQPPGGKRPPPRS